MSDTTPTTELRATLGRVTDLHELDQGACGTCADADGQAAVWPCETAQQLAVAEQLLRAVEQPLARLVLGTTDQQPETAPDDAALRDRIRRAVCEAEGFMWNEDMLEPDEYGEVADAVLAVLPAPVDRAAVLRERAAFLDGVLRDAADPGSDPRYWSAISDVVMGLRRLADEAQQPETEAAKCTYCGGHGVDPDDEGDWVPGVHMHDPGSRGPCPKCTGTRTEPAADQPDTETEAQR
ncbi:hypothetical protein OG693_39400 (plasmid) [Streptomyces sp. NBC_01259]|uniref:hypothetical protein n=1 Tax=Streptomyces sp. NBC_01259 TaxID=2903800 RepID=UPI002F91BA34